ncbi:peptidoglycan-binding domain-containing protein [Paracoccus luteus]|uniref:peptidoglycan-binding domain-containing protein n=1 Tax=Paracoccus luteus TaxID=2508543 RepID=UPI00106FAFB1|nr:peptidoglycan-binding domain-containing protein [Paracoccus luteus]
MRAFAFLIAALLPGLAWAEPVVLRLEAKRDAAGAAEAAGRWGAQFPDVVTFPLNAGWTAIALGPMERAEAQARLDALKAEGRVPGDSFLGPVPEGMVPAGDTAAAPADEDTAPAEPLPAPDQPRPGDYIRLQALPSRAEADAALADWRRDFPAAGLYALPDGWFAVALGPMRADTASAWLSAMQATGRAARDAFVAGPDRLGSVADAGRAPDLPPPGDTPMPPLDEVQRALRWAGLYDGAIDGKDGPNTRAAIAAEIVAHRAAPDAGTAMAALIERRQAWRDRMGLTRLDDAASGLSVMAPMDRLAFDRTEQGLSIYGPRDGSGAALILWSAPGGQQEMLDFTGLVTALGWVPAPERNVTPGRATLRGQNDTHIGQAEARVADGRAEGFVLIWPLADAEDQPRVAAELSDSFGPTPAPADDTGGSGVGSGGMGGSGEN